MYILNFLAESATGGSSSSPAQPGLPSWIIWVVLGLLLVVMLVPGFLRSKKQKKEYEEKMARMTVGSKVKTIGLIMGEIVSMTEDTVTLKTGDADHFSYVTVKNAPFTKYRPPKNLSTIFTRLKMLANATPPPQKPRLAPKQLPKTRKKQPKLRKKQPKLRKKFPKIRKKNPNNHRS